MVGVSVWVEVGVSVDVLVGEGVTVDVGVSDANNVICGSLGPFPLASQTISRITPANIIKTTRLQIIKGPICWRFL